MKPARPALRYHGSKWNLAPWIISHFPDHKIYVEPFGGGAGVLLRKPRSYAEVYNDLDAEVYNVFLQMRDNGPALKRLLTLTPFSRIEFEEASEPAADQIEQARRTIIKSFMGFGSDSIRHKSGFRANAHRNGTTPAHDWRNYADVLDTLIERLRGVIIECRDYRQVITQHDSPNTLFYVDPPYVHSTRTGQKRYLYEMPDSEHTELAEILRSVKGQVVLSGYSSDLYGELYKDWNRTKRGTFADGARPRTEVLWTNFEHNTLFSQGGKQ
jgi:DNA adenine methylase